MSLPSDLTPSDMPRQGKSQITPEQPGLAVAALIAFLGITYVGPALGRLARKPTLKARLTRRLRAARLESAKAGSRLGKRVRRLGGGTIWR